MVIGMNSASEEFRSPVMSDAAGNAGPSSESIDLFRAFDGPRGFTPQCFGIRERAGRGRGFSSQTVSTSTSAAFSQGPIP